MADSLANGKVLSSSVKGTVFLTSYATISYLSHMEFVS